ncbi:fimbrial protein [Hafnia alvei]|nr:fimbrial protein [Hafnia alvei]
MSPGAWAICTIARGQPTQLAIGSQLITISADAPIDKVIPIAQYDSPIIGNGIGYDDCLNGTEYGKRVMDLSGQDADTRIYATNIAGIGIKLLFSNGSAFGNFPSTSVLSFPNGELKGTLDFPGQSFYRIQFFKIGNLRLNNTAGDTILPAGKIAYNYIMNDNPASYSTSLTIGEIKIISTPTCTTDGSKTVDFNTVTPSLLAAGVTRNLDFSIVCKSDYGSYSTKASMVTNTPSSNGSSIRIEDAAGNNDRMEIQITDGLDNLMKVDGTTLEHKSSTTSQGPAEFSWKAKLISGAKASPAGGVFSAKAEIVFDIQ